MYRLTLTAGERKAINKIGNRHPHGHDLYKLLWTSAEHTDDGLNPITFDISEDTAWQVAAIGEAGEFRWAELDPALAEKLTLFCVSLI